MSEVWLFSLLIWYFKTAAYLKLDQLSLFQKGNQFCAHALSACLKWISTKADWGHLRSLLSYFWHWDRFLFDDNINQNWACWKDLLFTAVDECIPKRIPELHFSSVFTVDYYGNFPTADYVVVMRLESVNEVRRLLLKLKPHKSPGAWAWQYQLRFERMFIGTGTFTGKS